MAWPRRRIWHLNKKRNTRLECSWIRSVTLDSTLKRDIVSIHWAWGGDGFFIKRSRMMRTINCNQVSVTVSPSFWEYNIGLDSDALALTILRPLVVFGLSIVNGNEFFNLNEIRLNKREATRRKKIRNFFSRWISYPGELWSVRNRIGWRGCENKRDFHWGQAHCVWT